MENQPVSHERYIRAVSKIGTLAWDLTEAETRYHRAIAQIVKLQFLNAELQSKMKAKDAALLQMAHEIETLEARILVPRRHV